ncbi:ABC transporter permease [Streptomyces mutabilis]|uniref:ABC transporter permease n=1 Tax=Streptomyces mutabilis TaxID=67332 RepID=UPI0022BA664A|nr:ABC transporter permease [Streptomyces mutabilis]MCZ9351682.1 ABC transporter permease [Streptomyces mutabilis]
MSVLDKQGAAASEQTDPASASDDAGGPDGPKAPAEHRRAGWRGLPLLLNTVSVTLGIALWWALAAAGFKLPTPPEVVSRAGTLIENGTLGEDVVASLTRVLIGFALGTAAAVPVGFLMGWYGAARGLMEPWIQFFRTVPPLAIIPLAVVVMGIDETPKIFVIFLAAFLACVISTFQGVVNVDRTLIDAARVLGAKDAVIFARVVVPASTPFILVGMRVGLGSAWATLVAAELIAAQQGLGYRMQNAQLYYDLPTIFVGLISIGILGLLMDRILLLAERKLTGWQERR